MACSKPQKKITRSITPSRVKVMFLATCDPGGGKPVFKKGSVHELSVPSANHWITRRKAVKYVESSRPIKKAGRPKRTVVKAERTTKEPVVDESMTNEPVDEKTPEEEPAAEEKKTGDGESFGGMGDLMV